MKVSEENSFHSVGRQIGGRELTLNVRAGVKKENALPHHDNCSGAGSMRIGNRRSSSYSDDGYAVSL